MRCEHCNESTKHKKEDGRRRFCSRGCAERARYQKKKEELKVHSKRVCEREGCAKLVVSARKKTRTCSLECGYRLRAEGMKGEGNSGENPLNSNSNDLIRMINKFLLMKAGENYESV